MGKNINARLLDELLDTMDCTTIEELWSYIEYLEEIRAQSENNHMIEKI